MAPSLGVNLRVTGHCNQGGRKYMEDIFTVAYQQTDDEKDLEYAFFGIFDGHGGREAAQFAKDNLMEYITKNSKFWADDDESVLKAIREGFLETQKAMWKDLPNWRKTASGLPSTAGTTASIVFIMRSKLFIGHVGDSGIMLGERDPLSPSRWRAKRLTQDHKPECEPELSRIRAAGGKVVSKSGVPRVVWYRPSGGHQGPVRRSTHIDEVPFLAVARALGDLWSYNAKNDIYVVSPDPDLHVYDLNILKDRCLILGTDGVWNVVSPDMAVQSVFEAERNNEQHMIDPQGSGHTWVNPSKKLVDYAIDRWNVCSLRADNTSVVTVMLDPPGPPRAQVLRKLHQQKEQQKEQQPVVIPNDDDHVQLETEDDEKKKKSSAIDKGIAIISRYPNSSDSGQKNGLNLIGTSSVIKSKAESRIVHDSTKPAPLRVAKPDASSSNPVQCNEISSSDDETTKEVKDAEDVNTSGPSSRTRRQSGQVLGNKRSMSLLKDVNSSGPSSRTRKQSGQSGRNPNVDVNVNVKRTKTSLMHANEDSDAENNLPNHSLRQTRQRTKSGMDLQAVNAASIGSTPTSKKRAKTPEDEISPRILRPRNNTPKVEETSSSHSRKRQRSSYDDKTSSVPTKNGLSTKIQKTFKSSASNTNSANTPASARLKCLRSRMN